MVSDLAIFINKDMSIYRLRMNGPNPFTQQNFICTLLFQQNCYYCYDDNN